MMFSRVGKTVISRRLLSSSSKTSQAERDAILREANEKMKAYYTNRPSIEKIRESKRRRNPNRDREHYIQALVGMFVAVFIIDIL